MAGTAKLLGPRKPSPGTPDVVGHFLARTGLHNRVYRPEFHAALERRFPEHAKALYDEASAHKEGNTRPYYTAKNSSLDFSQAVNSQFWGDRLEEYLAWFVQREWPPAHRILDVGCDNGILTCFYAHYFPDAEVFGIDICPEAIERARELAAKLCLDNVQFHHADALDMPAHLAEKPYDLVASSFVACNIAHPVQGPFASTEECMSNPSDPDLASYAHALSELLAEGGTLVSADGMKSLAAFASWSRALCDSGIEIDWSECDCLSLSEGSDKALYGRPVLIGSKQDGASYQPGDIRALWVMAETQQLGEPIELMGTAAELVFQAMHPKQFVAGVELTLENNRKLRHEVWEYEALAMRHVHFGNGGRLLVLESRLMTPQLVKELDEISQGDPEIVRVERYDSPK